jgi:hypothetical protein
MARYREHRQDRGWIDLNGVQRRVLWADLTHLHGAPRRWCAECARLRVCYFGNGETVPRCAECSSRLALPCRRNAFASHDDVDGMRRETAKRKVGNAEARKRRLDAQHKLTRGQLEAEIARLRAQLTKKPLTPALTY